MRVLLHSADCEAASTWAARLAAAGAETRLASALPEEPGSSGDLIVFVYSPPEAASGPERSPSLQDFRSRLPAGLPLLLAASDVDALPPRWGEAGVCDFLLASMQTAEIRFRLQSALRRPQVCPAAMLGRAQCTLALSLAHDYNNLLSAIQGNVDLSLMNPSVSGEIRYNLDQIAKSAARAALLTRRLIDSLRPDSSAPQVMDLSETLRNLSPYLRELAGARPVEFDLAPEGALVSLSLRGLLALVEEFFSRLRAEFEPGAVRVATRLNPDGKLALELAAPGSCWPPLIRIFPLEPAAPEIERSSAGAPSGGTILLVDDEDAVRTAAQRILRREGYTVLEAASGEEGLELFRSVGGMLDAVVLDLHMPGIEGGEVLHHMRHLRPEVRVVVWSGFPEEEARRQMNGFSDVTFIEKPSQLADFPALLARALRQSTA